MVIYYPYLICGKWWTFKSAKVNSLHKNAPRTELGRGAAMIVESLRLYYHLRCFRCYVCNVTLGNGTSGADVRVRGTKLHCAKCFSTDETGFKLTQI